MATYLENLSTGEAIYMQEAKEESNCKICKCILYGECRVIDMGNHAYVLCESCFKKVKKLVGKFKMKKLYPLYKAEWERIIKNKAKEFKETKND